MRYRISFGVPPGTTLAVAPLLVQGVELEADRYDVIEGRLVLWHYDGPSDEGLPIIEYAAGVWRSICAVGAYTEATKPLEKPPDENPRRR